MCRPALIISVPSGFTPDSFFSNVQSLYSPHNSFYLFKRYWEEKGYDVIAPMQAEGRLIGAVVHFTEDISLLKAYPNAKQICVLIEPKVVHITNHTFQIQKRASVYDYVLTMDKNAVDNKYIFQFCYPSYFEESITWASFSRKKLLTNISGNKLSMHPAELYSQRLQVIRYFEALPITDFEFYGVGWDDGYKNYRGKAEGKLACLNQYRFAICFENAPIKGYITEKIMDCLLAGCVPIYWGAPDINEYIPKECMIDYTSFKDIQEMYDFIRQMDETEYETYRKYIRAYLSSDAKNCFLPDTFAETILRTINLPSRFESSKRNLLYFEWLRVQRRAWAVFTRVFKRLIFRKKRK
jgi:hypothetical protein